MKNIIFWFALINICVVSLIFYEQIPIWYIVTLFASNFMFLYMENIMSWIALIHLCAVSLTFYEETPIEYIVGMFALNFMFPHILAPLACISVITNIIDFMYKIIMPNLSSIKLI